jgi:hypothetical protein
MHNALTANLLIPESPVLKQPQRLLRPRDILRSDIETPGR